MTARFVGLGALAGVVLVVQPTAMQRTAGPTRQVVTINGRQAIAGEVLVKYRRLLAPHERGLIDQQTDADQNTGIGGAGTRRLHSRRYSTSALLDYLRAHPEVAYAEPNYIIQADAIPDDPNFGQLWGMLNIGQVVGLPGTPGADIGASSAWDVSTGSRGSTVAVVDTGIDYTHPDLAANVWSAPASFSVTIGGQTITCDPGTHGFNAITRTCDPFDDNGHGTHVSGTIGAVGNNNLGVVGVNWTASIMASKSLGANGTGTVADAIDAIEFVIQAAAVTGTNVRVLSNSWSSGGFSQALLDEINTANARDMLFVASAGNNGQDNDLNPRYPASYDAPNVIAVASTNNTDTLAGSSNYGATSVHLAAPGVNILSTIPDELYQYFSGTSMAAPHVSGAAALVLSSCALSTSDLKNTLLASVDPIPLLTGRVATGGRLNVNTAIRACQPLPGFSVTASPATQTVVPGGGTSYTATVTPSGGFTGTVTFSASGLPSDVTAIFSPPSVTGSGSSLMTVTSGTSAPEGSFPLTISGTSGSLVRTAAVTFITFVNHPPIAVADAATTSEDAPVTIAVLANDTNPDGAPPSLTGVGAPPHGTAVVNGNGTMTYTPAANYNGADTFTYTISDGQGASATGTVTVTITAVNDRPVAANQAVVTDEDTARAIALSATDVEASPLTYAVVAAPAHGTLSGTAPALTYTPAANYNGADSVTFKANDGGLDSDVATVSITIVAVNDAPIASAQNVVTDEDTAKSITLSAIDVEGSPLTYAIVAGPSHGTLSGTPPALTYTPAANYNGADSFTFTANDGSLVSNLATVSITVTAVDDPPPNPLSVDKTVFADGAGTVSTQPFSTTGPGELLVAFVGSDGPASGGQRVTVSGASLSWTLVTRANTRFGTAEIWQAPTVTTISNAAVSSTQTFGGYHQSMTVVAFMGAAGAGATAASGGSTGAPSVSLVPTKTGSLVYGVGNDWDGAIAHVTGPNQTLVHQWVDTAVGDTFWVQALAATANAGAAVTLNDTSPTNHQWNFAAAEILPAGPPSVISCNITAPAGGGNVSGLATISAHAVSTASLGGVQFQVDGVNLGAEVQGPLADASMNWDTTTGNNGSHTLTCIARDSTGNRATSGPVVVTVANATVPSVVNLTQGAATTAITAAGLSVGVVTTAPSQTVPAGSVISQNPAGGTRVAPGAAVALVIASVPQTPSGLVAAYGFNEGSGVQVADASGQGNTGTMSSATWTAAGKAGAALSFTTNGAWVTIPDAASLDLTTGMTIEAWVRPTSGTGWRSVVMKEDAGGLAYVLYSANNASRPAAFVHTNVDAGLNGASAVPLNTWTHLAVTYDGATLRMFVNGVQVSSRALTGAMAVTASPLRIGGNSVWGEYYRGLIDEVRIYNRALTAGEIQTDMVTPIL